MSQHAKSMFDPASQNASNRIKTFSRFTINKFEKYMQNHNESTSIPSVKNQRVVLSNSLAQNSINSISQVQNKSTYSFTGPERFADQKNANNFNSEQVNHLVTDQAAHPTFPFVKQLNENLLQPKQQPISPEQLVFDTDKLNFPSQRRSELQKIVENKKLYNEIKKQKMDQTKAMRIIKNGYKSGMLQIDSPESRSTEIYKSENSIINSKMEQLNKNRQFRIQSMEKFILTNPKIYFDNSPQQKKISPERFNAPPDIKDIYPFWTKKKSVEGWYANPLTYENIFGNNLTEQVKSIQNVRCQNLRNQDLRGKHYNIVSGISLNNNQYQ